MRRIENAGFRDVTVRADTKTLRLPPPDEFLWQYINSTPLGAAAAKMEDRGRDALERDVVAEWQPHVKNGALVLDARVSIAIARPYRDRSNECCAPTCPAPSQCRRCRHARSRAAAGCARCDRPPPS